MKFPPTSHPDMGLTLKGIRVLDLTRNLAGPYCTMILGDMGAEVIKVERPGAGDDTRAWAPPSWNGESTTFLSANRNKRSIIIDLDTPEGVELVKKFAQKADVFVESFRPGSLEKRGLSYNELKKEREDLIYCSLSAYGSTGPLKNLPGYDPILQAATGIMAMTGEPGQNPARVPISVIDLGAGMWGAMGILSAVINRYRTGYGGIVETSLYETAAWWLNYHIIGYIGAGSLPARYGSGTAMIAPYEVFPTRDEPLLVGAANDRLFRSFMEVLGLPDAVDDPRYLTNASRVENRDTLRQQITVQMWTKSASEWEALFAEKSIPYSRVKTIDDLVNDEQFDALGLLSPRPHPSVPNLKLVDLPMSLNNTRSADHYPPPMLGQHTDELLAEISLEPSEIDALREKGIIA